MVVVVEAALKTEALELVVWVVAAMPEHLHNQVLMVLVVAVVVEELHHMHKMVLMVVLVL
jgi:hypothetical protein